MRNGTTRVHVSVESVGEVEGRGLYIYTHSKVSLGGRWEKYEMHSFLVTVDTTPFLAMLLHCSKTLDLLICQILFHIYLVMQKILRLSRSVHVH